MSRHCSPAGSSPRSKPNRCAPKRPRTRPRLRNPLSRSSVGLRDIDDLATPPTAPPKLPPARDRVVPINDRLAPLYPEFEGLNYETPLQLLIAVILSAQCTDARVNKLTPALFARFTTARDFAEC